MSRFDIDRIIRYGIASAMVLFGLANILMGFGLGPFSPSPISVAAGLFLIGVVALNVGRR